MSRHNKNIDKKPKSIKELRDWYGNSVEPFYNDDFITSFDYEPQKRFSTTYYEISREEKTGLYIVTKSTKNGTRNIAYFSSSERSSVEFIYERLNNLLKYEHRKRFGTSVSYSNKTSKLKKNFQSKINPDLIIWFVLAFVATCCLIYMFNQKAIDSKIERFSYRNYEQGYYYNPKENEVMFFYKNKYKWYTYNYLSSYSISKSWYVIHKNPRDTRSYKLISIDYDDNVIKYEVDEFDKWK